MVTWKKITGHPEYEVSDTGYIRSLFRGMGPHRVLRTTPYVMKGKIENGYKRVTLTKNCVRKTVFVHQTVLTEFVSQRPDGMWALHKDGVKLNNCVENLYWGTPTQNCVDRDIHGNGPQRESNPNVKLSEKEVSEIRGRYVRGVIRQVDLAEEYGVTQAQISSIVLNKSWGME